MRNAKKRPNVIWIMSDQHAAHVTGCYGHDWIHTPNIDGLAREGVRFDNAYTPSPICTPARFSAMCGLYPHESGCTHNLQPLPVRTRTAAHYFSSAGYLTAFIGKMHPVDPQTHGFDFLVDMGHYYDFLGPKTEVFTRGMDARNSGCGCPWTEAWYEPTGWLDRPLSPGMPRVLQEDDHFESFVAHNCEVFLDRYHQQPFFLFASMIKPHYPFVSPDKYHAMYQPERMSLPETAHERGSIPASAHWKLAGDLHDPAALREAQRFIADYCAATSFMDACVGRIVDAVDRLGLRDDTVVIYTSDHGEMLYHHGLTAKFVYYEQSVRIPLIIRHPDGRSASESTAALTDLTDLLPTSMACCGLDVPETLPGRDLGPVLQDTRRHVREACYSELGDSCMIRKGRWKLACYPGECWHLFDLDRDPMERHNRYAELIAQPEMAALQKQLLAWKHAA